jgi:hypothetical protein
METNVLAIAAIIEYLSRESPAQEHPHRRIPVGDAAGCNAEKVINDLGDEVMKVFKVP